MAYSPARKIISPHVARDRIISNFPQAFHADATPCQKMNFHAQVREACLQDNTGTVGLKICKSVIVGDVAVGKSCLVNRFCHDVFDNEYKATIGVDFEVEKFSVLSVPFTLQMWDTAGQERFKCIAASYYRGANLVMVAFDLTEMESLDHARQWKQDACSSASDPLVFLVGLKKDLVSTGAYQRIEAEAVAVANELGAEYWAVSSKTGENVREFFFRVVALTFDRAVLQEVAPSQNVVKQSIGTIKVNDQRQNLYEKSSSKPKCC